MTVIAAVHDRDSGLTYIGSDSLALLNGDRKTFVDDKIIFNGRAAVAVAGDYLTNTIVRRHGVDLLGIRGEASVFEFVDRLRILLESKDIFFRQDGEAPKCFGSNLVFANHMGVWDIDSRLCPVAVEGGTLWARGSGAEYALGAGYALEHMPMPPARRVEEAINAAIRWDSGCGGKIHIFEIGPNGCSAIS